MAQKQQPAVSVTVEGGYGLEGSAHVGPVKVKGGGAVKGEAEISSNGAKMSVKAEVGGNVGPLKLPGGQVEVVTNNEEGKSEAPKVSVTHPGIAVGNSEATGWKNEITIGASLYEGPGGGVSVTVRPRELLKSFMDADKKIDWSTLNTRGWFGGPQ